MGKHSELYRKLADLVRADKLDVMEPRTVLDAHEEFRIIKPLTFRANLREIRRMLGKPLPRSKLVLYSIILF